MKGLFIPQSGLDPLVEEHWLTVKDVEVERVLFWIVWVMHPLGAFNNKYSQLIISRETEQGMQREPVSCIVMGKK